MRIRNILNTGQEPQSVQKNVPQFCYDWGFYTKDNKIC